MWKKTHTRNKVWNIFAFADIYAIFNCFCACNNLNYRGEKFHKQDYYVNNNIFLKQVSNSVIRLRTLLSGVIKPKVITKENLPQTVGISGVRPWLWDSVYSVLSSFLCITATNFFTFSVPLQMSGSWSSERTFAEWIMGHHFPSWQKQLLFSSQDDADRMGGYKEWTPKLLPERLHQGDLENSDLFSPVLKGLLHSFLFPPIPEELSL